MGKIDRDLESVLEEAQGLDSAAKREWQRRGAAEQEMATTVPPDVIAVLTEGMDMSFFSCKLPPSFSFYVISFARNGFHGAT